MNYFNYYRFFNSTGVRWMRVSVFFVFAIVVFLLRGNSSIVFFMIPLYFLLLLQEAFIYFKLNKKAPLHTVNDAHNVNESMTYSARFAYGSPNIHGMVKTIEHNKEVVFLRNNLEVSFDLSQIPLDKVLLLQKASDLVKVVRGKYIHEIDIYCAALLMANETHHILSNALLKEKDILTLLAWVRKVYEIDMIKKFKMNLYGGGVFDSLVYGWSAELQKYALNYTRYITSAHTPKALGREKEYDLLITALSKNSSSNVLLIGDVGVGKETLVNEFANDSALSLLPASLSKKTVFQLYVDKLLAGVATQGDLELRLSSLFEELLFAGNVVIYIPNIEVMFGGGGMNFDISGILSEYLVSNRIKIIGSTTPSAYQNHIFPKHSLHELFGVIELKEPDEETALYMLLEEVAVLETQNGVRISYEAARQAIALSSSYMNDGMVLPGRAVRLLDDVIANNKTHGLRIITAQNIVDLVEQKTKIVLDKPTETEKDALLHLEEGLHKRVVMQDEAINAIANAMRRARSGLSHGEKPIASFLFLGPTGVGKTETAKSLAHAYFGDEKSMIRLDMSEYQNHDAIDRILGGRNGYVENLAETIVSNPYTLILLDEFEKASPQILDLFLQILDEGRLTDITGRTVSFKNTIIIATSNAGSEFIREKVKEGVDDQTLKLSIKEEVMKTHEFRPELLNRFDDIIVFKPLTQEDAAQIAEIFLLKLSKKLSDQNISFEFDRAVSEYVAHASFSPEFGARNIARFIEQAIGNEVSKLILTNSVQAGGTVHVSVQNNSLVVSG